MIYSQGIWVLAILCALLLILFGGVTDRLIPLYAIGAFLAFTLSQAGMVMHWKRTGGAEARHSMMVNGLGATATAVTVIVVAVTKFAAGAWVTVLLIPAIIMMMLGIRRHYDRMSTETADAAPLDLAGQKPPLVVVPVVRWSKIAKRALTFALNMSPDVIALHIDCEEGAQSLKAKWPALVKAPAEKAGLPPPKLMILRSPYRFVLGPILEYILRLERDHPDRQVAVLIPELVEDHWYNYLLHNQRAQWLKAILLLKGNERIVTVNVPWYLRD